MHIKHKEGDGMSYKSPIEVITEEVVLQMEGDIVKAVQKYGINVNKIELQKALMYDRKQYTQGFEDGKKFAEQELIRHGKWEDRTEDEDGIYEFCSVCHIDVDITHYGESYAYCPNCGAKMDEVNDDR